MKESKSYPEMCDEGYLPILTLSSYVVIQHPTSFHTAVWFKHRSGKQRYELVGQYLIPGLASDPEVRIPAGMWREWMKVTKTKPEVYTDQQYYVPTTVRDRLRPRVWDNTARQNQGMAIPAPPDLFDDFANEPPTERRD